MVAFLKSGAEFQVNTTTASGQFTPKIAALPNGGYVITWCDLSATGGDTDLSAIRAQVFSATGAKVGGEILVNTTTQAAQFDPDIASLPNGGFVVTWKDKSATGGDTSADAIRAQVFSAAGVKVGGEILVNTTTLNEQERPKITTLNDGTFVIVWQDDTQGFSFPEDYVIRGQRFAANGAKLGGEILINQGVTNGIQDYPAVTALAGGGFLAAWLNELPGADTISFARFDSKGLADGGPATIFGAGTANLFTPATVGLTNGGFVIAYRDGATDDLSAEIYGPFGFVRSVTLNALTPSSQLNPQLAALPGGGFVAAWTDFGANPDDPSITAVRATVFDALGNRLHTLAIGGPTSSDLLVNTSTQDIQDVGGITVLANGDFVVTFTDYNTLSDGSGGAVRAQRFAAFQERGGTNADNVVSGGAGRDFVLGFVGADVLKGNAGDDILDGGLGSDNLDGGAGNDTASYATAAGGLIADLLTPANNDNEALGDIYTSIENLIGSNGGDNLRGNNAANMIDGGEGDDTLAGRGGADALIGAQGNDTASYMFAIAGVIVNLATTVGAAGEAIGDTFVSVENLTGSNFNDMLFGDSGNNTLMGMGGNDILEGGPGADRLDGGLGVNTASYSRATARVNADLSFGAGGGSGADFGDANGDSFVSIQNLRGSKFADNLLGNGDGNALSGLDGDDLLWGRGGADKLDGGLGTDLATYSLSKAGVRADMTNPATNTNDAAGDTYVSIENLRGTDFVDFLRGNAGANLFIAGDSGDTIDGAGGIDTVTFFNASAAAKGNITIDLANSANNKGGEAEGDIFTSIENVTGTNNATGDTLMGDGIANVLSGLAGDDTLVGNGGSDALNGGNGNDTLDGGDGNDVLDGGDGNDVLTGGSGNDTLSGATGNDTLIGGIGSDILNGGGDIDTIIGEAGNDTANGGDGGDDIDGGDGNDLLNGEAGNDHLVGGIGNDKVNGGLDSDILLGGDGNDLVTGGDGVDGLSGGKGNDVLVGGAGNDVIEGNEGKDIIVFDFPTDGIDSITAFTPVDDTLRFDASNFKGGLVAGVLPASRLVTGTAPTANKAFGQFLYDTDDGILSWDADGNSVGGPVTIALFPDTPALTTADFQIVV